MNANEKDDPWSLLPARTHRVYTPEEKEVEIARRVKQAIALGALANFDSKSKLELHIRRSFEYWEES